MSVRRSTIIFAWVLLLPAVFYVTVIVAYPLVDTFVLSFTDASLKKTTKWVGTANYDKIFNATFAEVILRTFVWTAFSVTIKMIIGTFGAVMLNAAVPGRALFACSPCRRGSCPWRSASSCGAGCITASSE